MLFLTECAAGGASGMVAFATRMPGSILPLRIGAGDEHFVHATGFHCGTDGTEVRIGFQRALEAARHRTTGCADGGEEAAAGPPRLLCAGSSQAGRRRYNVNWNPKESIQRGAVRLLSPELARARSLAFAAAFVALLAASSYVSLTLPFTDVPFTLQVLVVVLAGVVLGPRLGFLSMLLYLLLGAVGVPVFAGGSAGIGAIVGPFGGYLVAMPFAALTAGALRGDGYLRRLLAMIAALLVIYLGGVLGLHFVEGASWRSALLLGVLPFIGWDALKIAVGAAIAEPLRRLVGEAPSA